MRKFYLPGSTIVRSFFLLAIAAGSFQSLQAQTCTNATSAGPCTGGNVNENFNTNSGTFSSTSYTYNAGGGNYQATVTRGNPYTITSGVYVPNATGGNVGFNLAGSTAALSNTGSVTIRILDASTSAVLFTCTQSTANFIAPNQVCVQYAGTTVGTPIRYQFVFNTANGSSGDGTLVFDNFSNGGAAAALPVKLDNFEATNDGGGIRLSWKATEESGVVRYEIQRSTNGVSFQTIGSIPAESKKVYSYVDVLPTSSNNFYRLRIVDVDNTTRISHIVSVKSKVSKAIEAYPNPVRDRMIVQHPKAVTGTRLQVVNLTGQVIRDMQVPANAVVTPVDMTGLSNGTYYLVFRSGAESFSQRVTKQ